MYANDDDDDDDADDDDDDDEDDDGGGADDQENDIIRNQCNNYCTFQVKLDTISKYCINAGK